MQAKTFSCGNCNNNFAHSQSVIMHEKNHVRANQFAVIFKIFIQSQNSCRIKTFSCGNCDHNFAHSESVSMHEKNHARANQFAEIFKIFIYSQNSCSLKTFSKSCIGKPVCSDF